jgi:ABC-type antimicrobial peptide transport system permease subunit
MSSETHKADLSSLRINRNVPESKDSGAPKRNLIFYSSLGGALIILAAFLEFVSFSTTNFTSFTELAFGFHLTPVIVVSTLLFSLFMGLIGGFLPAVRASQLNIISALRAS